MAPHLPGQSYKFWDSWQVCESDTGSTSYMAVLIEKVNNAITFEQSTLLANPRAKNLQIIVLIPLLPCLNSSVQYSS